VQCATVVIMKPPIFVRTLSEEEHEILKQGLRSSDSFVLRRSQILLASARGEHPPRIAENLGCGSQTVRNAIHAFNAHGLDALKPRSSRPRHLRTAFEEEGAKALREILHQDPRNLGKEDALWTLEYAAQVSFEQGITQRRVTGETIRATLDRLGVRWERAKRWIESPDPEYARKKGLATG
jgi:transposase